jgi:hypothetical protein
MNSQEGSNLHTGSSLVQELQADVSLSTKVISLIHILA